jgi:hypothetical protein
LENFGIFLFLILNSKNEKKIGNFLEFFFKKLNSKKKRKNIWKNRQTFETTKAACTPPLACYRNFIVDHQSVPACQSVISNKQLKQLQ